MTLQDNLNKLGSAIKQHSPEILTVVSVAGLGATAYLTGRASFRAGLIVMADSVTRIDAADPNQEPEYMGPKDIIKETWKLFIPAAIVGVVTATAMIGSNRISHSRNVALFSAAAIGEQAFREYREKVVETTSKPKERKVHDEIAQDEVNNRKDDLDRLVLAKDGDVMVIEMHTRQVFVSNAEKIHRAENEANRICVHEGYISLNTFLDKLGLPESEAGEVVGWTNEKPLEVIIGGAAHDEKPVLTIDYRTPPSVTYRNPF